MFKIKTKILIILSVYHLALIVIGFFLSPIEEIRIGLLNILKSPSILVTDYIAIGGLGATFINAGLVGIAGIVVASLSGVKISGLVIAGVFTMSGFAMFGKNIFNIWPIIFGVCLFSKLTKRPLKNYIAPCLFGTTLAPTVSQTAFGFGFGILWGIVAGIIMGMLVSALAKHVYSLHQGYNLYNVGTTGGIVGTIYYIMLKGFGFKISPVMHWSREHTGLLFPILLTFFLSFIILGLFLDRDIKGLKKIIKESGRLITDFVEVGGLGSVLINMGILGILGLLYIKFIGGDINGPVIAGIFTIVGFGALGKHIKNVLPIMLGVYLICIPKVWLHSDPGPTLAALFGTTLAPFSGRFGPFIGLLAGMLHLPMVMHVGEMHGYMNLYNNGFSGGLVAIIIVAILRDLKPHLIEEEIRY
ncbi:MAG: DUF1576 domain-containing protein [bacterium]|nr:DUF1576 domain-containing protein [bacterium]